MAVGENFTVNCTYPCDRTHYLTHTWVRPLLHAKKVDEYDTQSCNSASNRTHELLMLALNETRDLQSINCVVHLDNGSNCVASARLEVLDEAVTESTGIHACIHF